MTDKQDEKDRQKRMDWMAVGTFLAAAGTLLLVIIRSWMAWMADGTLPQ